MGVMQDRRRIIEAQPHLVTASGETLEINVAERKVEKLKVSFYPVQTGSGTPSPTNVRPISGWSSISVALGSQTATADFSSAIHGGTLDLVSGTGLTTWNIRESTWSDASAFSAFTKSGDNRIFWIYLGGAVYNSEPLHILSDQYTFAGYGYDYAGVPVYSMCGSPDYTGSLWVKVPASDLPTDNLAGAQAFFQQTLPKFYWPRTVAGRTAISTTPQTILAPRGQQTVSSPAGSTEITYWTH